MPPPPGKQTEEEPTAPKAEVQIPQERVPENLFPTRAPTYAGPDLFNPPPHRGFITLTPSFTLSGEYDDNVGLSSQNRRSDGIFRFVPGGTFTLQKPGFRIAAGVNTSAELFVDDTSSSGFGKEVQFFADVFYQLSPTVTLSFSDNFIYDRDTNTLTSGGVSVGFEQALRNTVTGSARWQATPNTTFSVVGSETMVRFFNTSTSSDARDSDTYRLGLGVDHRLTQRWTGGASLGTAYIDIDREKPAWTFTPALTTAYDITRTLRGWLSVGPTIVERDGDISLFPSIGGGLTQAFKFGSVTVGYDRAVTAETVGLTDRQAFFGTLDVPTLLRGLRIGFTPRYAIADTDVSGNRSGINEKLHTFTMTLQATYQIARSISLIGSYTYFHQTSDRRGVGDIDQNRVFLGIQYAYPITIY